MTPRESGALNEMSRAIGSLERGFQILKDAFDEERRDAAMYRQQLRETVAAMSEAQRLLIERTEDMQPHVKAFAEQQAQARGRATLGRALHATWLAVVGILGGGVGAYLQHKLPILIIFAWMAMLPAGALAQEHSHPPQDRAMHEKFYSTWKKPNVRKEDGERTVSCCGGYDCYPAEITFRDGTYFYRHRETGKLLPIPAELLEHNQGDPRESPDGQSHVCANPQGVPYCATLGSGI